MNYIKRLLSGLGDFLLSLSIGLVAGFTLILGVTVLSATLGRNDPDYSGSIVKVMNREGTGGGTGWSARTNKGRSVIVTNDHVCTVAVNDYVVLEEKGGRKSIKPILARSIERDLCVIEGLPIPPLKIADKNPTAFATLNVFGHPLLNPITPATGQYVADGIMQIGFSTEEDGTCRGGELRRLHTADINIPEPPNTIMPYNVEPTGLFGAYCVVDMELSYTTVPIFPGNSGSPVTNTDGEVIGVMNSASTRDNRGNFIPLIYLKQILEE